MIPTPAGSLSPANDPAVRPLILFDIDATLLKTHGAGVAAMVDAGREVFGPAFHADGLEFAGRLDPLIFTDLFRINNVSPSADSAALLRATYLRCIRPRLAAAVNAAPCPGVLDLLGALRQADSHALGILTGNFRESGTLKLQACALDPLWFPISVWGDDSPHVPPCRDHLPEVAIARYRIAHGHAIDPSLVTVIGDTPHDIRCARACGCRSIGVATGAFSVQSLRDAGATGAVECLSDTRHILSLLQPPGLQRPPPIRP